MLDYPSLMKRMRPASAKWPPCARTYSPPFPSSSSRGFAVFTQKSPRCRLHSERSGWVGRPPGRRRLLLRRGDGRRCSWSAAFAAASRFIRVRLNSRAASRPLGWRAGLGESEGGVVAASDNKNRHRSFAGLRHRRPVRTAGAPRWEASGATIRSVPKIAMAVADNFGRLRSQCRPAQVGNGWLGDGHRCGAAHPLSARGRRRAGREPARRSLSRDWRGHGRFLAVSAMPRQMRARGSLVPMKFCDVAILDIQIAHKLRRQAVLARTSARRCCCEDRCTLEVGEDRCRADTDGKRASRQGTPGRDARGFRMNSSASGRNSSPWLKKARRHFTGRT